MKSIFLISILVGVKILSGQTTGVPARENMIYDFVEQSPEYPGGIKALERFLASNIMYPISGVCVEGTVYVKFVVNDNGTVSDVVVLKGIGFGCDEEAIRVVSIMDNWRPGRQNGKVVNVYYTVPIKFIIY